MKIAVYDKKNTDRLLGYIEDYNGTVDVGRIWSMPIIEKVSVAQYYNPYRRPPVVSKVEFRVAVRSNTTQRQVDRLTCEKVTKEVTVFTTDAPLSELRELRGFKFPQVSSSEEIKRPYYHSYTAQRMADEATQRRYEEHRAARMRHLRRLGAMPVFEALY
jgi:hypothetical protein